jgi:hypothetical protein
MPAPAIESPPQDESAPGSRTFAWVPGSVGAGPVPLTGTVPAGEMPMPGGVPGGARARVLDWQALLEALAAGGFLDGQDEDHDVALADMLAAEQDGRMGPPMPAAHVAGLAIEHMAPGPALAGWLGEAVADVGGLDEYRLVGLMVSARQLTSWAQAVELAAVAGLTASCAAADPDVGIDSGGRPARVTRDAVGQVALALRLSDYGAGGLINLAVTLAWRLQATAAALAEGRIDLYRARLIAEATSVLSEDAARAVEAAVLPAAWQLAPAQLRAKLRRAVIAADPQAAEQRRTDAERQAAVNLYPDPDGTATLSATKLPQAQAAAAMAKITAIARAMKAAGWAGGLDLLRAAVMLHLILGTLPYIPPPDGGPPDSGPPDGGAPDGGPPDRPPHSSDPLPRPPAPGSGGPGPRASDPGPGGSSGPGPGSSVRPDGLPPPRDGDDSRDHCIEDDDDQPASGPVPPWPDLGAIPPALAAPSIGPGTRPSAGLLDVTLPWATWAGLPGGGPGTLGRIGPITPDQARQLARAAECDPAATWRIIITNSAGHAIAVTRLRRRIRAGPVRAGQARAGPARAGPARAGPTRAGPVCPGGLFERVTLTISQELIADRLAQESSPLSPMAAAALAAAIGALDRALVQPGAAGPAQGCAHAGESPAYRPSQRLRELVIARDVTCRFPTCRQPAWRADLDHTIPYEQGGRSCACNLGGRCRKHHILKQHPRWKLEQNERGEFTWSTPAGRRYVTQPDVYQL